MFPVASITPKLRIWFVNIYFLFLTADGSPVGNDSDIGVIASILPPEQSPTRRYTLSQIPRARLEFNQGKVLIGCTLQQYASWRWLSLVQSAILIVSWSVNQWSSGSQVIETHLMGPRYHLDAVPFNFSQAFCLLLLSSHTQCQASNLPEIQYVLLYTCMCLIITHLL